MDASEGKLASEAEGEVYLEDKVLVIKRIRVRYTLTGCPDDKREAAERSHSFHASRRPVAKSIERAIEISAELNFERPRPCRRWAVFSRPGSEFEHTSVRPPYARTRPT